MRISLPDDYVGKTVSVISYYSKKAQIISPTYICLNSYDTENAQTAVHSVLPVAIMTLSAILAILTTIIFVLDISNGKPNWRILFITFFFVLLFIDESYMSLPGTYSILTKYMDLSFLAWIYPVPLFLYVASCLTGWRKYVLSGLTIIWFIYEVSQIFWNTELVEYRLAGIGGLEEILVFSSTLVLVVIELLLRRKKKEKIKVSKVYVIITLIVIFLRLLYELKIWWNGDISYFLSSMTYAINDGSYTLIVDIISEIFAITAVIILIIEFIKRTLHTHESISVLKERNRMSMESYHRMVESENATSAARHEMRHHILALSGMIRNKNISRAQEYLASLEEELDEIPCGRYSQNMMINVLAGTYLDRAKAHGVKVRYRFNIPKSISIADNDLCVFITNMLENAVKACEKVEADKEKYININIGLNGNFLFIGCENSCCEQEDKNNEKRHSFGIENMEKIAKKYNGVLKVERKSSSFSVMSTLCLTKNSNETE